MFARDVLDWSAKRMFVLGVLASMIALVVPVPTGAVGPVLLEGEDMAPVNGFCAGDGERMRVINMQIGSGGKALFFPQTGCRATVEVDMESTSVTALVHYRTTGNGGAPVCGAWQFFLGGAQVGSTASVCSANGHPVVGVGTFLYVGGGDLTVRWTTSSGTPGYANGLLDVVALNV